MWYVWVWKVTFFSFLNKKQLSNPSMMYFIFKLCIQNNLSNIIKCENKCFFFLYIQIQWEKLFFSFLNKKQWPNPSMMYFIPKLCIQNNLSNTTKCENKCFFFFFYIQIQWEKLLFSFLNKKQWPNSSMMYFIPKLCIQNNLSNTTKCENKFFLNIQIQDLNIE